MRAALINGQFQQRSLNTFSSHLHILPSKWRAKATRLRNYGRSTRLSTNLSRTGLDSLKSRAEDQSAYDARIQGYRVADEEINMDLARFRELYSNNMGVVECVFLD